MLICVFGEDGYRISQKLSVLREGFVSKFDKQSINVSQFTHKDSLGEILSSVRSGGLLSQKRFVCIHGLVEHTKTPEVATWASALCATDSDAIIVLVDILSTETFKKKPLAKALEGAKDRHDYVFPLMMGRELERWAVEQFAEHGKKLAPKTLQALLACTGSDTWRLHGEIEKLSAYVEGEIVNEESVKILVEARFEERIFDFVDAVSQGRTREAVALLENERSAGSEDGYLLFMLLRQVRILLSARSLLDESGTVSQETVAKELGVHPFVAKKALVQARRYELAQLLSAHELLFDFDQETKRGMETGLAVERVMVKMLSS